MDAVDCEIGLERRRRRTVEDAHDRANDSAEQALRRAERERAEAAADREEAERERAAAAADREEAVRERAEAQRLQNETAASLELAATDELTGAWTRRFGLEQLTHELARAHRTESALALVFVDVDGLKQINDDHGHLAGDELLTLIAEVIRAHLRPYDTVVRYGGDEFVCAMPNTGADQAQARFDEIADVLRVLNPEHSISFGVAEAESGDNLQSLISRADEGLLESRASRDSSPGSGGAG
jgi:diguanylate cyclase (GGDEF)-like protein